MALYAGLSNEEMVERHQALAMTLERYKSENLDLNMARGKPCTEQLDLSDAMLDIKIPVERDPNKDYRNYGTLDGLPETKRLFADILEVATDEIIIGGNSSLNMMYTALAKAMLYGAYDSPRPWSKEEKVVFLCPVPGYDRHFAICEQLGIQMIAIPMNEDGPDMDVVESYVAKDPAIKGMWCVPKYSNPSGITYSDEVVERLAAMKTAAVDFKLMWDNAYVVHDLYESSTPLLNVMEACKKAGNPHRAFLFTSMSKVTFAGAAVAAMAASVENIKFTLKILGVQTIGSDKINQYRHYAFLKDLDGVKAHMKKHAAIITPKFELVLNRFEERLTPLKIARWSRPVGGYFIDLNVKEGCAKAIVQLADSIGLKLTPAGATFPYGYDPEDSNIRIAPTFPPIEELAVAMDILCDCIEYVSLEHDLDRMN